MSTLAEKGNWRIAEDMDNEYMEQIETIKVAKALKIKNERIPYINLLIINIVFLSVWSFYNLSCL